MKKGKSRNVQHTKKNRGKGEGKYKTKKGKSRSAQHTHKKTTAVFFRSSCIGVFAQAIKLNTKCKMKRQQPGGVHQWFYQMQVAKISLSLFRLESSSPPCLSYQHLNPIFYTTENELRFFVSVFFRLVFVRPFGCSGIRSCFLFTHILL